jgi:putative ABC transport system permease protein
MQALRSALLRLKGVVAGSRIEEELDDELRFHLEMEAQKEAREGIGADEARRRALVSFGGVERFREDSRHASGLDFRDALTRDSRLALRGLVKNPVFTFAAVGTLALAIGATTAIFSVVDAVLLRPSPFADPQRLVMVWETDRASGTSHEPASWPDVVDFSARARTLASIGSMMGVTAIVSGPDGAERVAGLAVTPGLLETLRLEPVAGRGFAEGDWVPGVPAVALLGEEYWRNRFGSDPEIVGRTLTVNDAPVQVAGVLPAEADLGIRQVHARADYSDELPDGGVALWLALLPTEVVGPELGASPVGPRPFPRSTHPFLTLGRLADGSSIDAAQAELAAVAADLEATFPENESRGVNLESYGDVVFGPTRTALSVLLGAVVVVLLIACANVANLLLARTVSRSREVSLRQALGAARAQLRRQFMVEAVVLTGLGALVGVGLAFGLLQAILGVAPSEIPRLDAVRVDGSVLVLAVLATAGAAVFFGVLPVAHARTIGLLDSLGAQADRRSSEGGFVRRLRSAFVVSEVALAVVLIVGAGVLLRGFWTLASVDPGFDAEGVATLQYVLPPQRYPSGPGVPGWPNIPETNGFHASLLDDVRALPGVDAAAVSATHPLEAGFTNSFVIVGREEEAGTYPEIRIRWISPGYVETLGVPVLAGRALDDGDVATAPPVALINQAAAELYFGTADPVGQEIRWWGITRQIVGVIGNERFLGLDVEPAPAAYVPIAQGAMGQATLVARTDGDPAVLSSTIRDRMRELDPEVPTFGEPSLAGALSQSVASPRFTAVLIATFAGAALLLALIGVHGVVNHSVTRRSHEVGIRMALGATRRGVLRSVVGEGLRLAVVGVALGVAGAFVVTRALQSFALEFVPAEPAVYALVVFAVLAAAATASFVPALRASGADPSKTLRTE